MVLFFISKYQLRIKLIIFNQVNWKMLLKLNITCFSATKKAFFQQTQKLFYILIFPSDYFGVLLCKE